MSLPTPVITMNGYTLNSSEISSYNLTYNKLWKNADRNMDGVVVATLIGVYPNIKVVTSYLKRSEAEALSTAINQDFFNVTYWDTQTSSEKTAVYYAADHEIELIDECRYGQVTIELVAKTKANYI